MQLKCAKSHEIVFRSCRLRGKVDQRSLPCPLSKLTNWPSWASSSTAVSRLQITSAVCLLKSAVRQAASTRNSVMASPTSHSKTCSMLQLSEVNVLCASLAWILFRWRLQATWVIPAPLCKARLCRSLSICYWYVLGSWRERAVCLVGYCTKHTFFTCTYLRGQKLYRPYSLRTRTHNKSLIRKN